MFRCFGLILLTLVLCSKFYGQIPFNTDSTISFRLGAYFPSHFQLQFNYQLNQKSAFFVQGGKISSVMSNLYFNYMTTHGLDDDLRRLIEPSYKLGSLIGLGFERSFSAFYVSFSLQFRDYTYSYLESEDLFNYFGTNIQNPSSNSNLGPFYLGYKPMVLAMQLNLGKTLLNIKNRFFLNAEISWNEIFWHKHFFSSNYQDYINQQSVKTTLDVYDAVFRKEIKNEMCLPYLGLHLTYRLKSCDCN